MFMQSLRRSSVKVKKLFSDQVLLGIFMCSSARRQQQSFVLIPSRTLIMDDSGECKQGHIETVTISLF